MFSPASDRLVKFIVDSPRAKTVIGIVIHGINVLIGQYLQGHSYLQTDHTQIEYQHKWAVPVIKLVRYCISEAHLMEHEQLHKQYYELFLRFARNS